MRIEEARHEILTPIDGKSILKHIEACGRVSYNSEDKITENSAEQFVRARIKEGHESLLEHVSITTKFITDRGVMAELTRHRMASFVVQSTRYCNYSKDKYGNEITVIKPSFLKEEMNEYWAWKYACVTAGSMYMKMLEYGCTPQEARAVLPNSLKTVIVMTANLRELRTILKLRTDKAAHPSMRELMIPFLNELKERIPVVFDDIEAM